ncbi:hypothetical protein ACP70R_046070 [Stipagrostis hirtigluma subsp. patula]
MEYPVEEGVKGSDRMKDSTGDASAAAAEAEAAGQYVPSLGTMQLASRVEEGDPVGMEVAGGSGTASASRPEGARYLEMSGDLGNENTPPLTKRREASHLDIRPFSLSGDWMEGVTDDNLDACHPIERTVLEEVDQNAELPEIYSDPKVLVPKVGQPFKTDTDAFNFYNIYSMRKGFGIRLNKNRFNADE